MRFPRRGDRCARHPTAELLDLRRPEERELLTLRRNMRLGRVFRGVQTGSGVMAVALTGATVIAAVTSSWEIATFLAFAWLAAVTVAGMTWFVSVFRD